MRKIVLSYRDALEDEIAKWKAFRDGLPSEEEEEAFDDLMDMCQNYASAGRNATGPIIFEPMLMSSFYSYKKKKCNLEKKLDALHGIKD